MGLEEVVPSSAAQGVADDELENVEGKVSDDAEEPYRSSPSPPDPFDPREVPACIYSNQCGQLQTQFDSHYRGGEIDAGADEESSNVFDK